MALYRYWKFLEKYGSIILISTNALKLLIFNLSKQLQLPRSSHVSQYAIKMKPSCHISSHTVANQISFTQYLLWIQTQDPSSLIIVSLSLSLCQGGSLFVVIRRSATFNQPLSQMSHNTLFMFGLIPDKHAAGGLVMHPTRGVI